MVFLTGTHVGNTAVAAVHVLKVMQPGDVAFVFALCGKHGTVADFDLDDMTRPATCARCRSHALGHLREIVAELEGIERHRETLATNMRTLLKTVERGAE
jgi:hypothetical protein